MTKSKKNMNFLKSLTRNQIGKKNNVQKEYNDCFPGHSSSLINYYFNSYTKPQEKWFIFKNKQNSNNSFCAFDETSIDEILNEYSRYQHKDFLLSQLNKMYKKQTRDYRNICISKRQDFLVYWIHSLCVFKKDRGKGLCQKKILPELIEFITRNCDKTVLLLADIIEENYPSFNCFFDNGFDCTQESSEFYNKNGFYFNTGLDKNCKMLLRVVSPIIKGGKIKNKKIKNKKTKKKI